MSENLHDVKTQQKQSETGHDNQNKMDPMTKTYTMKHLGKPMD